MSGQTSGIGFYRESSPGEIAVWQRDKAFQLAQGGFVLDKSALLIGQVLKPGTPLVFDEIARTAKVLAVAAVQTAAGANDTTYRVKKGTVIKQGQVIAVANGGKAVTVTNVDRSNAVYDVITTDSTLGEALDVNRMVFVSNGAAGADTAAFPAINGLLYEETKIVDGISQFVSAVIRGTVYARRVPYSSQLAALPGLAHIIYSQSL